MKKKLTMMLLALVVALGGTSTALLTGCNKPNNNGTGNVTENEFKVRFLNEDGSLIAEKKVKSGEKVEQVTLPAKAGYTAEWVDKDGNAADLDKGVTADAEYKVKYTAKTDVEYKVDHYVEKTDGTYELEKTETKKGTTATTATAEAITKEHYTLDEKAEGTVKTGEIKGDGSLVLKLYYKLDRVTVTFMAGETTLDTMEVRYGALATPTDKAVPPMNRTDEEEYAFKHWSATENGTEPFNWQNAVTAPVTVYAVYEKTTRKYDVVADFNNVLYYFLNANGDTSYDEINAVPYGDTVSFKVQKGGEAAGTVSVKIKVINSAGEKEEVLTPNEDGVYSFELKGETEIIVTGLTYRIYNVTLDIADMEYAYDWAKPYKNIEDVKFEVTEEGKDAVTADLKIENGKVAFTWTKGKYSVRAFVEENGAKRYISDTVTRTVDSFAADKDGNVTFDQELALVTPVDIQWNDTAAMGNDGKITAENGKRYSINFTDFAPGNEDFAVTVTYDQLMSDENKRPHGDPSGDVGATNDPSLGFIFWSGEQKLEIPLFDAGAVRVWEADTIMFEHRSTMAKAGSLLGRLEWPDCYRHAELTYVKVGGWMYIVVTADGEAGCYGDTNNWYASSAKAYTEFVPAMIDLEKGIMYVRKGFAGNNEKSFNRDTEYLASTQIGKYESVVMKDVLSNITAVTAEYAFGDGKSYSVMSGYGYTTDKAVLAEMEKSLKSEFSVTANLPLEDIELKVDGEDYTAPEVLTIQQTRVVTFKVPAGKTIAGLTIGGKDAKYEREGDVVTVNVSNDTELGSKALVISLEEGKDAVISGTVSVEGNFTGKDSLDNVLVRFLSETGAMIRATYDKTTKKYSATVPAGTWTLFASNGYISGEAEVKSVFNKDATADIKLTALASVGADAVTSGGMIDNGDGTYTVNIREWGTQENAMKNVTFVPENEVLEFVYTITGINKSSTDGNTWPFVGMFVKSADGGMWRIALGYAGDQMIQMPQDDLGRYAFTERKNEKEPLAWEQFGPASGWYTYGKDPNYKVSMKIRIDGYKLQAWCMTGTGTEWSQIKFDNDATTFDLYDFWSKDSNEGAKFDGVKNRKEYLSTLYKTNQECQFGISVRRDAREGQEETNVVKMSDISYSITAKN